MVRILAKGILLLKGSEEILRLRTVACSKVLKFLENVFEELQLLVRELLPGDGCRDCNLRREGHWKDEILLLRYGLVDLARTAGMLRVRLPFQIENLRIETEHEVAHQGLVAFQAIVLAEAAGAVALKH